MMRNPVSFSAATIDSGENARAELLDDRYIRLKLIGCSATFLESMHVLRRVAGCDATLLIRGETGTGKELAARGVHYLGSRANEPFIPMNCGAIPENLIESELFGHTRGAFTDAREARSGVVAQAEGGTLFLDEIESMNPRMQVALLRFLQDQEYRPVGGSTTRCANVRIIGASNVDLARLADDGGFRHDLLFRLNVLTLDLPPLRERGDDVVLLARSFVQRFCRHYRKPEKVLAPEAEEALRGRDWPGNVRELENLIHREVILDDAPVLRLSSLRSSQSSAPAQPSPPLAFREARERAICSFEKAYLIELLHHTRGNISLAARVCGKERSRLGKLVKKYGLKRAVFAESSASS